MMFCTIFPNTILVSGFTKTLLIDLYNGSIFQINSDLKKKILNKNNNLGTTFLEKNFSPQELSFLTDNNLAFKTKQNIPDFFKIENTKYRSSSIVESLDIILLSEFKTKKGIHEFVNKFNIKNIFISIRFQISKEALICLLELFSNSKVRSISVELYFPFIEEEEIILKFARVLQIVSYNNSKKIKKYFLGAFYMREQLIPVNFIKFQTANAKLYIESIHFNTYFNKKLFLNEKGTISADYYFKNSICSLKNIPSTFQFKLFLKDIMIWNVKKDSLSICQDCEFRHVCINKLIPKKRIDQSWFYTEECSYNPYIGKWKGEEGYQSLSQCGVVSDKNEFSINHEKIAKINEVLWE